MAKEILPIEALDKLGFIADSPAATLQPGAWSDVRNVRFKDGAIRKILGEEDIFANAFKEEFVKNGDTVRIPSQVDLRYIIYWENPNVRQYVVINREESTDPLITDLVDAAYTIVLNEDGEPDTRRRGEFTQSEAWQGTQFNGGYTVIINNGISTPNHMTSVQGADILDSDMFVDLPGWDSYLVPTTETFLSQMFSATAGQTEFTLTMVGADATIADVTLTIDGVASTDFTFAGLTLTYTGTALTAGQVVTINFGAIATASRVQAGIVIAVGNVLLAGRLEEQAADGTVIRALPGIVRSSDVAAPGSIPQNWNPFAEGVGTADEIILADTGQITALASLRGNVYVYTSDTINQLRITPAGLASSQITTEYGAVGHHAVYEFKGRHMIIGSDDIYQFSGNPGDIQSVADKRVRRFFLDDVNALDIASTFIVRDQTFDELWLCYVSLNSVNGSFDQALIWNYTDNVWTKRDLPNVRGLTIGPVPGGGNAFDEYHISGTTGIEDTGQPGVGTIQFTAPIDLKTEGAADVQSFVMNGTKNNDFTALSDAFFLRLPNNFLTGTTSTWEFTPDEGMTVYTETVPTTTFSTGLTVTTALAEMAPVMSALRGTGTTPEEVSTSIASGDVTNVADIPADITFQLDAGSGPFGEFNSISYTGGASADIDVGIDMTTPEGMIWVWGNGATGIERINVVDTFGGTTALQTSFAGGRQGVGIAALTDTGLTATDFSAGGVNRTGVIHQAFGLRNGEDFFDIVQYTGGAGSYGTGIDSEEKATNGQLTRQWNVIAAGSSTINPDEAYAGRITLMCTGAGGGGHTPIGGGNGGGGGGGATAWITFTAEVGDFIEYRGGTRGNNGTSPTPLSDDDPATAAQTTLSDSFFTVTRGGEVIEIVRAGGGRAGQASGARALGGARNKTDPVAAPFGGTGTIEDNDLAVNGVITQGTVSITVIAEGGGVGGRGGGAGGTSAVQGGGGGAGGYSGPGGNGASLTFVNNNSDTSAAIEATAGQGGGGGGAGSNASDQTAGYGGGVGIYGEGTNGAAGQTGVSVASSDQDGRGGSGGRTGPPTTSRDNIGGGSGRVSTSDADAAGFSGFRLLSGAIGTATYPATGVQNGLIHSESHSLNSVPGAMLIKRTSGGNSDWIFYHKDASIQTPSTPGWFEFRDGASQSDSDSYFANTFPTATEFFVGNRLGIGTSNTNEPGDTYINYLFASNELTGGASDPNGNIHCGFYDGTSTSTPLEIDLGWDPELVIIKNVNSGETASLVFKQPNSNGIELTIYTELGSSVLPSTYPAFPGSLSRTGGGFVIASTDSRFNSNNDRFVYLAIRPSVPPAGASSAFSYTTGATYTFDAANASYLVPNPSATLVINSDVDISNTVSDSTGDPQGFMIVLPSTNNGAANSAGNIYIDKFYAAGTTDENDAQITAGFKIPRTSSAGTSRGFDTSQFGSFDAAGYNVGSRTLGINEALQNYAPIWFKNAPGFFELQQYRDFTSGGSTTEYTTRSHSLGTTPVMIWVKSLDENNRNWVVGHAALQGADASMPNGILTLNTPELLNNSNSGGGVNAFDGTNSNGINSWDSTEQWSRSHNFGELFRNSTNDYIAMLFAGDIVNGVSSPVATADSGNQGAGGVIKKSTPTVNLGWRPQFIMIKQYGSTILPNGSGQTVDQNSGGEWSVFRDIDNFQDYVLLNLDNAAIDATSPTVFDTGFTYSGLDGIDGSGEALYIYYAFRENPSDPGSFPDFNLYNLDGTTVPLDTAGLAAIAAGAGNEAAVRTSINAATTTGVTYTAGGTGSDIQITQDVWAGLDNATHEVINSDGTFNSVVDNNTTNTRTQAAPSYRSGTVGYEEMLVNLGTETELMSEVTIVRGDGGVGTQLFSADVDDEDTEGPPVGTSSFYTLTAPDGTSVMFTAGGNLATLEATHAAIIAHINALTSTADPEYLAGGASPNLLLTADLRGAVTADWTATATHTTTGTSTDGNIGFSAVNRAVMGVDDVFLTATIDVFDPDNGQTGTTIIELTQAEQDDQTYDGVKTGAEIATFVQATPLASSIGTNWVNTVTDDTVTYTQILGEEFAPNANFSVFDDGEPTVPNTPLYMQGQNPATNSSFVLTITDPSLRVLNPTAPIVFTPGETALTLGPKIAEALNLLDQFEVTEMVNPLNAAESIVIVTFTQFSVNKFTLALDYTPSTFTSFAGDVTRNSLDTFDSDPVTVYPVPLSADIPVPLLPFLQQPVDRERPWAKNILNEARNFIVSSGGEDIRAMDLSHAFAGDDIISFVERRNHEAFPLVDTEALVGLYINADGDDGVMLDVALQGVDNASKAVAIPITGDQVYVFNVAGDDSDYKIDTRINNRLLNYRISNTSQSDWELQSLAMAIEKGGTR